MTPERQKKLLAFAKALRGTPSTAMAGVELREAVIAVRARDKTIADLNTAVDELTKQGEQYIEQRNTRDNLLRQIQDDMKEASGWVGAIDDLLGEEAKK